MRHKLILALGFILLLVSCQTAVNQTGIELNNGEKWKVNSEMMPPIQASVTLIEQFNGSDLTEYHVLAEKLAENNQLLISSCTMTGKSHDELHKWLHPYIGRVDELAKATDQKIAGSVLDKIKKSFEMFDQYFE